MLLKSDFIFFVCVFVFFNSENIFYTSEIKKIRELNILINVFYTQNYQYSQINEYSNSILQGKQFLLVFDYVTLECTLNKYKFILGLKSVFLD